MALEERIKEHLERYYLTLGPVELGTAASWFVPCPAGGELVAAHVSGNVSPTSADCVITFEIATVATTTGGSASTLTIPTAGVAGSVYSIAIDGANVVKTAEDADLLAAGGQIEVITDGGGGGDIGVIVLEMQP